jgi:putative ABC transport system substrate-binding protein
VLYNTGNPTANDVQRRDLETAADAQDIKLMQVGVIGRSEIERAFQSFKRAGVSAVIVLSDPMLTDERREIANRAIAVRLATIFGGPRDNVVDGGLINYNIDVQANWRLAGLQVGRILKGERPANIAVEYPPKLSMAINRRTALAIGAYIPPDVLRRAEDIIE